MWTSPTGIVGLTGELVPAPTSLTPLALMILALLREGDMHPYEMMRLLIARRDERIVRVQKGTIYHTVARLEREGLVAEVGIDRDGNRPERTTYTLTPAGDAAVAEWVRAELPRIDRAAEFRVALAEAHNLPRAEVAELLALRHAALADSLAELRSGLDSATERRVPEQFLVEADRQAVLLDAELAWQAALTTRLVDGTLAWGLDEVPQEFLTGNHPKAFPS